MKDPLVRFSVAIGGELLQKFDEFREQHQYPNRSEAVRGLMRAALIQEVIGDDATEAMGVVTLIYDHHAGRVGDRLTEIQHHHLNRVVTTTHVHLDARRCLQLAFGPAKVRAVAQMVEGPLAAICPGSALQQHSRATVILDENSAAGLNYADHYRWIDSHKLAWQRNG